MLFAAPDSKAIKLLPVQKNYVAVRNNITEIQQCEY